jgi:uncharacterized OB-fold protein
LKGPGADDRYWQALAKGHLEMQRCEQCGRWNWPAVWRCGVCGSWKHAWIEVPSVGRIFTWTRTWHDFGAPRQFGLPFVTVVVTLDGAGQRRLLGTMSADGTDPHIGLAVRGSIESIATGEDSLLGLRWHAV